MDTLFFTKHKPRSICIYPESYSVIVMPLLVRSLFGPFRLRQMELFRLE